LTLDLPKPEIALQPQAWVPATKLASVFAAQPADVSVYCSQCKVFYASPIAFFEHIPRCD
ncbi:hypothetical protein IWQ56_004360, partial [Coemansia nantahalensis]